MFYKELSLGSKNKSVAEDAVMAGADMDWNYKIVPIQGDLIIESCFNMCTFEI